MTHYDYSKSVQALQRLIAKEKPSAHNSLSKKIIVLSQNRTKDHEPLKEDHHSAISVVCESVDVHEALITIWRMRPDVILILGFDELLENTSEKLTTWDTVDYLRSHGETVIISIENLSSDTELHMRGIADYQDDYIADISMS